MDKLKARTRLKRFVYQMGEVVLKLLCPLDVDQLHGESSETVDGIFLDFLILVESLNPQTHVPADSPHRGIVLHVRAHPPQGIPLGHEAHIEEHCELWLEFLAEPIEEPIMGG